MIPKKSDLAIKLKTEFLLKIVYVELKVYGEPVESRSHCCDEMYRADTNTRTILPMVGEWWVCFHTDDETTSW